MRPFSILFLFFITITILLMMAVKFKSKMTKIFADIYNFVKFDSVQNIHIIGIYGSKDEGGGGPSFTIKEHFTPTWLGLQNETIWIKPGLPPHPVPSWDPLTTGPLRIPYFRSQTNVICMPGNIIVHNPCNYHRYYVKLSTGRVKVNLIVKNVGMLYFWDIC